MSETTALEIRNSALELGFDGCGIVSFEALKEYEQVLDQRIQACPNSNNRQGTGVGGIEPICMLSLKLNKQPWVIDFIQ